MEDVSNKRKELTEQMKIVLSEGIGEFMKEHPVIKAIGWVQYTPYFNDGDTCEFSVGEIYVSFTDDYSDDIYEEEDGGWHSLYSKPEDIDIDAQTWHNIKTFSKALSGAEQDMQAAFGDHVRVIISQEGIDIEEYEHD